MSSRFWRSPFGGGALVDGAHFGFDRRQPGLDVAGHAIGFLAALARFVSWRGGSPRVRSAKAFFTGPPTKYASTPMKSSMLAVLRIQPGMPK